MDAQDTEARTVDVGIVTDEVAARLEEALTVGRSWGLTRFELREGGDGRFPLFTLAEVQLVEQVIREGSRITAVSPGILKGHVEDEARLHKELDGTLPRALEMAVRFGCPVLIVFGFERYDGEPEANRVRVLRAFERAAEAATDAGLVVAVENEPDFWVDQPAATAALFDEIGHPALKANWDPANLHWGGTLPTYEGFQQLAPYLANLHVKDYYPDDPQTPWRPVGQGRTPWPEIIHWVVQDTSLEHVTLETHCAPLQASSAASVDAVRRFVEDALS